MEARRILLTKDASIRLGVASQTMRGWRQTGRGPAFICLSVNRIGYEVEELDRFVAARRFQSNAERKVAALAPSRDRQPPHIPSTPRRPRSAPVNSGPDRAA